MRSARVRKPSTGVSLFPFLAVLICTMGAIIVMLMMVVQQARVQADVVTRDKAEPPPAVSSEEQRQERQDYEWRREMLEKQRTELTQRLAEERLELGHLEDHIRRLKDRWQQLVAQREQLDQAGQTNPAEGSIKAEQARLRQAIGQAQRELEETKQKLNSKPRSYAIIPYDGPNGTHRRPIYIECRGDAIIFQPEGVQLGPSDFEGPLGPGNPFDATLRAVREYLSTAGANRGGEPYPLLVVRPDGAVAYACARSAMKSWDDEFGYELIDQNMQLQFPASDPQLAATLERALQDARRRQEMLARVAPSRFKGISSGGSRGGGGEGGSGAGFNDRYAAEGNAYGGSSAGRGGGTGIGLGGRGGNGYASSGASAAGGGLTGGPGNGGLGGTSAGDGRGAGGQAGAIGNNLSGTNRIAAGAGPSGSGEGQGAGAGGEGPGGVFYGGTPPTQRGADAGQFGSAGGSGDKGAGSGGSFGDAATGGKSGATTNSSVAGGGGTNAGNAGSPAGSPGGTPGSAGDSTGASSNSAGGGSQTGAQSGLPSLHLGANERSANSGDPPKIKNRHRRPNWALPDASASSVGYTRPIRVSCSAEQLVVLPERGDGLAPHVLPLSADVPAPIEDLVDAVHKHIESWGIAGKRAYWKPVLSVHVAPGGQERFAELQSQLAGSGLEVKRK